jgi:hypothetical protein
VSINFRTLKFYQKYKYLYRSNLFLGIHIVDLWNMTSCCSLMGMYWGFEKIYCLHLQGNLLLQNLGEYKRLRGIINRLTTIWSLIAMKTSKVKKKILRILTFFWNHIVSTKSNINWLYLTPFLGEMHECNTHPVVSNERSHYNYWNSLILADGQNPEKCIAVKSQSSSNDESV